MIRRRALVVWLALLAGAVSADEPPGGPPVRYLALGDSYTIGEGVGETQRWPAVLVASLRAQGTTIDAPRIIARTGWTTDELERAIDEADPRGPFDLVTLLVGVNDQYRGRDQALTLQRFEALLERAIAFAGGSARRVVVVSIPDWGVTPFAEGRDRPKIAAELDALNAAQREAAKARGAGYVDVTAISREARAEAEWLAEDRLHPGPVQYARWAAAVEPAARAAVRR